MDGFPVKLQMLLDILAKKEESLTQILSITENQHAILAWDASGGKEMFLQMNAEKQGLIDSVLQYDAMFDNIFKEMGGDFEKNAPDYKDTVKALQTQIKNVTELDVMIRAQEDENLKATPAQAPKPNTSKASHKTVMEDYARFNKKPR